MDKKQRFDYSRYSDETANRLRHLGQKGRDSLGRLRVSLRRTLEESRELGQIIEDAHGELAGAGRDGDFDPWVASELDISRMHADRLRRLPRILAEIVGEEGEHNVPLSDIKTTPTVLIEIDKLPEPARSDEIGRVASGEKRKLREVRGHGAFVQANPIEYKAPERPQQDAEWELLRKARSYFAGSASGDAAAERLALKIRLATDQLFDLANDFEEIGHNGIYEIMRESEPTTRKIEDLNAAWGRVSYYLRAIERVADDARPGKLRIVS